MKDIKILIEQCKEIHRVDRLKKIIEYINSKESYTSYKEILLSIEDRLKVRVNGQWILSSKECIELLDLIREQGDKIRWRESRMEGRIYKIVSSRDLTWLEWLLLYYILIVFRRSIWISGIPEGILREDLNWKIKKDTKGSEKWISVKLDYKRTGLKDLLYENTKVIKHLGMRKELYRNIYNLLSLESQEQQRRTLSWSYEISELELIRLDNIGRLLRIVNKEGEGRPVNKLYRSLRGKLTRKKISDSEKKEIKDRIHGLLGSRRITSTTLEPSDSFIRYNYDRIESKTLLIGVSGILNGTRLREEVEQWLFNSELKDLKYNINITGIKKDLPILGYIYKFSWGKIRRKRWTGKRAHSSWRGYIEIDMDLILLKLRDSGFLSLDKKTGICNKNLIRHSAGSIMLYYKVLLFKLIKLIYGIAGWRRHRCVQRLWFILSRSCYETLKRKLYKHGKTLRWITETRDRKVVGLQLCERGGYKLIDSYNYKEESYDKWKVVLSWDWAWQHMRYQDKKRTWKWEEMLEILDGKRGIKIGKRTILLRKKENLLKGKKTKKTNRKAENYMKRISKGQRLKQKRLLELREEYKGEDKKVREISLKIKDLKRKESQKVKNRNKSSKRNKKGKLVLSTTPLSWLENPTEIGREAKKESERQRKNINNDKNININNDNNINNDKNINNDNNINNDKNINNEYRIKRKTKIREVRRVRTNGRTASLTRKKKRKKLKRRNAKRRDGKKKDDNIYRSKKQVYIIKKYK